MEQRESSLESSRTASQSQDTAFFSTASATPSVTADETDEDEQVLVRPTLRLWSSPLVSPADTETGATDGGGHAVKPLPNGLTSMVKPPSFSLSAPTTPTEASCCSDTPDYQTTPRPHARAAVYDDGGQPKVGGFGVRHDHVSHQHGMTSPATQRATAHERARSEGHAPHPRRRADVEAWGAQFWYIITDPSCRNNTFFANPHTGACQWEVEAGTIVLPPHPHGEWWQLRDARTALPYFYHTQTGQCVWERPATGLVIPLVAVQETVNERSSSTDSTASRASSSDCNAGQHGEVVLGGRTKRVIRFSESQPAANPTLEQLLTGRARCSILDRDRQLVAQALATSPLPHSLPPRRTAHTTLKHTPSIHVEGSRIVPSSRPLEQQAAALPKSTSLGNLRAYHPGANAASDARPVATVSFSQSYDTRRLTVRRQRDPAKRNVSNGAGSLSASQSAPLDARLFPRGETRPSSADNDGYSWRQHARGTSLDTAPPVDAAYYLFAVRSFAVQRAGPFPFRRKVAVSALLKWQKAALNAPLFPAADRQAHREGVLMFRVLQKIMGDREGGVLGLGERPRALPLIRPSRRKHNTSSSSSAASTGPRLDTPSSSTSSGLTLSFGLEEEQGWLLDRVAQSAALRDEMYAQTVKQLTANPRAASLERGRHWLAVLLSHAPPSADDKMYTHIRAFLDQHTESADDAHAQ